MKNFKMMGNENDTYLLSENGIFLVSSVDWLSGVEEVSELPSDVVEVDSSFFYTDLVLSESEIELMLG